PQAHPVHQSCLPDRRRVLTPAWPGAGPLFVPRSGRPAPGISAGDLDDGREWNTSARPARGCEPPGELVNYAGDGLPLYLWGMLADPGESAWDIGRKRAARDEGSFSYRNAIMIEAGGGPAGCLIGYEIPDRPAPIPPDMPAMFVPLQELEN